MDPLTFSEEITPLYQPLGRREELTHTCSRVSGCTRILYNDDISSNADNESAKSIELPEFSAVKAKV